MSTQRGTVAELRRAFDESFTRVPSTTAQSTEQLLMIRVGAVPCALRVSEIAALLTDHKIVPLPSPTPELLGIVGLRVGLVPVYNLATLLGHSASMAAPRWLVLCAGAHPVALAFSELEGYRQIPQAQIYPGTPANEMVRVDDVVRVIISIPALVATIETICGKIRGSKEQ